MPVIRDIYPSKVTNLADPEQRGRIKVECRALLTEGVEVPAWVEPCFPYAGEDLGWFFVPPVGSVVELEVASQSIDDDVAAQTEISTPEFRWRCGNFRKKSDVPTEFSLDYPNRLGIKTAQGQVLVFDETVTETIIHGFSVLRFGSTVASEPMVLGEVFIAMMAVLIGLIRDHKHLYNPGQLPPILTAAPDVALDIQAVYTDYMDGDRIVVSDKIMGEK